ncbi:hypothetical protein [Methylocaldum gracile]|jgi:hypothetical protein|uniref:hypothetical protein n=1 Tax=Methylocaldum sp. 0917 TaxID=2485163 RepID=UPI00105E43CC
MKTKVKNLKNGRIVVETRAVGDEIEYIDPDDGEFAKCGAIGTFFTVETTLPRNHGTRYSAGLCDHPDGVAGNMNKSIRCHHGWRGTTGNRAVYAHGRRQVIESRPLSRGVGWRTVLSADLSPNEE